MLGKGGGRSGVFLHRLHCAVGSLAIGGVLVGSGVQT